MTFTGTTTPGQSRTRRNDKKELEKTLVVYWISLYGLGESMFKSWIRVFVFCDVAPRLGPRYINFFKPFQFTAGVQPVVLIGASHIYLRLQEIQSREWEKKNKRTRRTIRAWG